ncbi:LacI family DNA-binding transcriptional regulator [Lachnospiraceae bacterium LCP25S3_G4]
MKKKELSIKDIAEKAEVSVATVSRVMNQNGRFSKETEQKVLNIIEEYDFRPNELARGLRINKSQVVGVIVPDITNEFFACIVREIEKELLKKGYMTIICDTDEKLDVEQKHIDMLKSLRIGGMIYVSGDESTDWIKDIPAVYVDRQPKVLEQKAASSFIGSDNYQGGYIATKCLIEAGRRRIAMVIHDKSIATQAKRLNGYKQALQDYGIPFDEALLVKTDYVNMDNGYAITKELWESKVDVDGIFYAADILAIGALKYFNEKQIKVPSDISIIGFDDIPLSSKVTPALTTVKQGFVEFGKIAANSIVKMMNGDADYRKYILSVELMERETV